MWTATFSSGDCVLSGNIKINVHYYEDGNVQLTTSCTKQKKVGGGVSLSLVFFVSPVIILFTKHSLGCYQDGTSCFEIHCWC